MKFKRIIISATALLAVATPITLVVSCGSKTTGNARQHSSESTRVFVPVKETSKIKLANFLKENRKLKQGEYVNVKDDVVVLANAYYTGTVQDISTIYKNGEYAKMEKETEFKFINGSAILPRRIQKASYSNRPIIELNDQDSLIYFFDKDDNDGRSISKFYKQVMFQDSAVFSGKSNQDLNKKNGFKNSGYNYDILPFAGTPNKGFNNEYLSSTPDLNSKAKFAPFLPKTMKKAAINFEVIGPNAIKVYFSKDFKGNFAKIGKIEPNPLNTAWDAELSIGDKSQWKDYNKQEANIVAPKSNEYLIIGKH